MPPAQFIPRGRKYLILMGKIVFTAFLLIFLFRYHDAGTQLVMRLGKLKLATLTGAVLLLLGQAALNAVRWRTITILIGPALALLMSFRLVLIGLFFNQVLPSAAGGDILRWWYARRSGIPSLDAVNGLLLDRIIGMLTLLFFILGIAPFVGASGEQFISSSMSSSIFGLMVIGVIAILFVDRLPAHCSRAPFLRIAFRLAGDSRLVLLNGWRTSGVVALSAAAQMLPIIVVYLLAGDLGIHTSLPICMFVVPAALLCTSLPFSVAGWGVREGAFVIGFGLFSISPGEALAVSIVFGIISLIAGLTGGIVWWFLRDAPPIRPAPTKASLDNAEEPKSLGQRNE